MSSNRDPFQIARFKQDVRNGVKPMPSSGKPLPEDAKADEEVKPKQDISLNIFMGNEGFSNPTNNMDEINSLMGGLGLGEDSQFDFDDLGQAKLITALRKRLGPEFTQNKSAQRLLELFAQQMKDQSDLAPRIDDLAPSGERVLDLLKGGMI